MTTPRDQFNQEVRVDSEHYRIHNGQTFIAGYGWLESVSTASLVADNASVMLHVVPGAGMHAVMDVSASGDCDVYHYKETSSATTGTELTNFNKNEFDNKTSDTVISWGTTAMTTDLGTAYPGKFLPGGSGGNAVGGQDGGFARELIMASGTNYATVVTNRSGGVASISITYEWYEPTNTTT